MPTMYPVEDNGIEEEYYLLGKYSETVVKEILLAEKKVKAHRILSDLATQDGEDRIVPKKGYVVVNHQSYGMPWKEELLTEYYNEGVSCSERDVIILNLTGNSGGCSDYPQRFYEGVNGTGENGFWGAYLPSPPDICDEVKKYNLYHPDSEVQSAYPGTMYVVMNNKTASSAEMGISSSYYLKNAVRVGSGSFGCSSFGNCIMFQLPNSKLIFCFGHRLFYHDNFEEGKGFLPDFWIDDANPVRVVEEYLLKRSFDNFPHTSR